MSLSVGIVGLPNVGKSTLFNALASQKADAANYPFCTIDPNLGVVTVPDKRFDALVKMVQPVKTQPATVDFVDIAGLVRGASKGEGRGNAFLSHIRECEAIAHVVRCFINDDVVHVDGRVNPASDAQTIETELILRDLDSVQKRGDKAHKLSKSGQNPVEAKIAALCDKLIKHFDAGHMALTLNVSDEEEPLMRDLGLLTRKPMFYVGNVSEAQLNSLDSDANYQALVKYATERGCEVVPICAAFEAELGELPEEERAEFLASAGLKEPGLNRVIQTGYKLLSYITFFTAGVKEVRAWTIQAGTKAPQAAGKIHTDFEKTFIRAEVISCDDFLSLGGEAGAKAAGKLRVEGKDYVMQDGDVVHYRVSA